MTQPVPVGFPTLEQVREWIRVPATAVPDDQLRQIVQAHADIQARLCRIPEDEYPAALAEALCRRVQRHIAAKQVPLGLVNIDATEFGPARVPNYDPIVFSLEASYRIPVIA